MRLVAVPAEAPRKAAAVLPAVVPRMGLLLDALPEAVVTSDREHRVTGWNLAAERLFGYPREAMLGASVLDILPHRLRDATDAGIASALSRGEIWSGGAATRDAAGNRLELRFTAAPIGQVSDPEGFVVVAHDITIQVQAERAAEIAEARFADFMAAAPAIAFVKDRRGTYLFANDHGVSLSGDAGASGWKGKTDYDLWPPDVAAQIRSNDSLALAASGPLESIQVVTLADGPHTLLMHKFPLRSATGDPLLGGIGLDITDRVRAMTAVTDGLEREARTARLASERVVVAAALGRLRSGGTVISSAKAIAELILGLPGLEFSAILLFELDGRATPIGLAPRNGPVRERRSAPLSWSRTLRRRALKGAWAEPFVDAPDNPLAAAMKNQEITKLGYAPIHSGTNLLGVLVVGATGLDSKATIVDRLPAMVEFAGLTGAMIGADVASQLAYRKRRRRILDVIEANAFHPVYQPIVDLADRRVLGYEALTRFADGCDPARRFADGAAAGLDFDLEMATLVAAIHGSATLPAGTWLNVNVSPDVALATDVLRPLLQAAARPVVCEITEHVAIADYVTFRAAIAELADVRLAVDDAGAGFASFRHIVELHPAFVKLDRSLITSIDADPLRQALIVGMHHFAVSAGCDLIAEGIETDAELDTLLRLGVRFGQGFLLGMPAPAPAG